MRGLREGCLLGSERVQGRRDGRSKLPFCAYVYEDSGTAVHVLTRARTRAHMDMLVFALM